MRFYGRSGSKVCDRFWPVLSVLGKLPLLQALILNSCKCGKVIPAVYASCGFVKRHEDSLGVYTRLPNTVESA